MRLLAFALACAVPVLALALWGTLHVDEGHYHAAGRLVLEGKLPYRDFIYVQAPVYPFAAALLQAALGPSFTAARLTHGATGIAALVLGALLARRGGSLGVAVYAAIVIPNLFTLYHLTFIKLYPIAALFLTAAFVLFERDGLGWQSLAFACAALAVGTRLSLLPAFVILIAAGLARRGRRTIVPALAGLATLAAVFVPPLLYAREQLLYDMFTYHFEKDAFTARQILVYKLDSLSGIASHFWPALMLASAVALGSEPLRLGGAARELAVRRVTPWLVAAGLVLSHIVAKGPNLHLYLTSAYPYLAGAVAAGAAGVLDRLGPMRRPVLIAGALAFSILLPAQARETLTFERPPTALRVDRVADDVRRLTDPDQRIVSFCLSIPVAASRHNLERYEMNAVTYDPAWDAARCRKLAILRSEELVAALVDGRVGACLVTDDSFIGNFPRFYNPGERGIRPDVMDAIRAHFVVGRVYPGLGYFGRDATLWVRRPRPILPSGAAGS